MRTFGKLLLTSALGALVALDASAAFAKKVKRSSGDEAAPKASSSEVNKLKAVRLGDPKAGTFKWGMKPDEDLKTGRADSYHPTKIGDDFINDAPPDKSVPADDESEAKGAAAAGAPRPGSVAGTALTAPSGSPAP